MRESIVLLAVGFGIFQILLVFALSAAIKQPARKLHRKSSEALKKD